MGVLFICKECGTINNKNTENGTRDLCCSSCNAHLSWRESFPPLYAQDFISIAHELFESIKDVDKANLNLQYLFLSHDGYEIDLQKLDKYRSTYEKILEKYPDNDDTMWLQIIDQFEEQLSKELDINQCCAISSAMAIESRNRFRKPYVIIVAAIIEQLFYDFFKELIILKESKMKVKMSNTAGISTTIHFLKAELNIAIHNKMEQCSKGFYNRWANLRKLRNRIIHSNSIYVSRNTIIKLNKMIDESILVFGILKSQIYLNSI